MSDAPLEYPDVVLAILVIDCLEPQRLAPFWSELLGRRIVSSTEHWVNLEWAPRFGVGLSFQRTTKPKTGKNRVHMDIFCANVEETVARVEAMGGKRAEGYPESRVTVMQDPEDNEFCLLPKPGGG